MNDLVESSRFSPSDSISKGKNELDLYENRFIDDSYIARGLGLIAATVGRQTDFYLYSKHDNDFENIVIEVKSRNGEVGKITILDRNPVKTVALKSIPIDCSYDEDRIKVTYVPCVVGVHTLTLLRYGSPICRSPYYVSVEKSPTNSRSRIRLGTKKYKMVTKFGKSKCTPTETKDNSTPPRPVCESSKPTIKCSTIHPIVSEESTIKTDVMSIVTKFESKSMNINKMPPRRMTSITERNSEYDVVINTIPTTFDLEPITETSCKTNNNVDHNVSNVHKTNFKFEAINENDSADEIDKQNKVNELSYENSVNIDEGQKIISIVIPNKNVETKINGNTSPSQQEPINNAEKILKNENMCKVRNQTTEIDELLEKQKNNETHIDMVVDPSKTNYIGPGPGGAQSTTFYYDDEDKKTVVVVENANELESNPNNLVSQQNTDCFTQYEIKQPLFTNIITKITDSVCEKCSKQVLKILSEFPRDINITHNKRTNEVVSSIETLLTQPIRININIDNVIENASGATQEHKNTYNMQSNQSADLEHFVTSEKYNSPNEIELVGNLSEDMCVTNSVNTELVIGRNKKKIEISTTSEENKTETSDILITKQSMETNVIQEQNIFCSSADDILLRKYSKDEEHTLTIISCDAFNDNVVHNSENKIESYERNQQISDQNLDLSESNQTNEIIDKELNHTSEVSVSEFDINNILIIKNNEKLKTTLDINDSKSIESKVISNENEEFKNGNVDNTVYKKEVSDNVLLDERLSNELHNEHQNSNGHDADNQHLITTTELDENQKLMMEKLIEPVLNNYFKKNIVRRVLEFCLKKDVSNINDTQIFENEDMNSSNQLCKLDKAIAKAEINIGNEDQKIENNDTSMTGETKYDDKSEILANENLDHEKIDNNNLLKLIEHIIKANMILNKNNAEIKEKTKLHNIIHTAINYSNGLQKDFSSYDYDEKKSNYTQATITNASVQNKVISNGMNEFKHEEQTTTYNKQNIMDNIENPLVKIPNIQLIEAVIGPQINNNNETVIMNDSQFGGTESKQKLALSNDIEKLGKIMSSTDSDTKLNSPFFNSFETTIVEECNCAEIQALSNNQKSNDEETSIKKLNTATEHKTLSVSNNLSINNISLQESNTVISNETETNDMEKQNNEENLVLVTPEVVEKNIITSKTVETEIIKNETIKDQNTDEIGIITQTINETEILTNIINVVDEQQCTSAIITPLNENKIYDAKSFTVKKETIVKLQSPNVREIIIVERPDTQNKEITPDTLVFNGISTVKIEIDGSDTQESKAKIVLSIKDSNILLQGNISNVTILKEIKTVVAKESNPVKPENLFNYNFSGNEINIESITENVLTNEFEDVCIKEIILNKTEPISYENKEKKYQHLSEEIKETLYENCTSNNIPVVTTEESIKDEKENLTSKLTKKDFKLPEKIINVQMKNIDEPFSTTNNVTLPTEEHVSHVEMLNTIKSKIDLQFLPANNTSKGEEKTIFEKLTLNDSSTIPNKEVARENIANLPENPASGNSSFLQVGESMEKMIENSDTNLPKTDFPTLPFKEPVEEVETLSLKSVNIDVEVLPTKDLSKIDKETEKETLKKEIENHSENPTFDKSSLIPMEETMEPIAEMSVFTLPTTDSFLLPIEELVKEVGVSIMDIDSQVFLTKETTEVEKEIVSKNVPLTNSLVIPNKKAMREEIQTLSENIVPNNSSIITVELGKKITENSTTNLISTGISPIQIEVPVNVDIEITTNPKENITEPFSKTETPVIPVEDILEKKIKSSLLITCDSQVILPEIKVEVDNKNTIGYFTTTSTSNESIEYPENEEIESINTIPSETDSVVLLKYSVIDEMVRSDTTFKENNTDILIEKKSPVVEIETFDSNTSRTNIPILPVEELAEKEIETIITKSADSVDSSLVPIEGSIEVITEKLPAILNTTNIVVTPIESLTILRTEIISQVTQGEKLIGLFRDKNIPEHLNTIGTPVTPADDQVKENVEISATNLALAGERIKEFYKNEIESFPDTSAIPVNSPVIEELESQTTIHTDRKTSVLSSTDSSEIEKKIVFSNIVSTEIPTIPTKGKIELSPTKPALEDYLILPVKEQIETIVEKHGNLNIVDTTVVIVEEPLEIEINTETVIPTEIISRVVLPDELVEMNKKNKPEHLNTTDKPHVLVKEPVKEKTEDFLIIDSRPAKVQQPMEVKTNYINKHSIITEASAQDKEKIIPVKSSSNDSSQSSVEEVEMKKQITLQIITTTLDEEPINIKEETLTSKPTGNYAQISLVEEPIEVEINYKPEYFTLSDTSIIPIEKPTNKKETSSAKPTFGVSLSNSVEKLVNVESEKTLENLTIVDALPTQIEEPTNKEVKSKIIIPPESDLQILTTKNDLKIIRETASDDLTTTYTPTKLIEETMKVEVETLTTFLADTNETKEIDERNISEYSSITNVPVVPIEQLVKEEVQCITTICDLQCLTLNKSLELDNESLRSTNTTTIPIEEPEKEEIITITTALEMSSSLPMEDPIEKVKEKKQNNFAITDENVEVKQVESLKMEIESLTKTTKSIMQVFPAKKSPDAEKNMDSEKLTPPDPPTTPEEKIMKEKIETLPTKPVEGLIEKNKDNQSANLVRTETLPTQIEELRQMEMKTTCITMTEIFSQILPSDGSVKVEEGTISEYPKTINNPVILTEELMRNEAESIIMVTTENDSQRSLINKSFEEETKVIPENKTIAYIPEISVEKIAKDMDETMPMNLAEEPMGKIKANLLDSLTTNDTPPIQIEEGKKLEMETTTLTEIISQITPSEQLMQVKDNNTTKSLTDINTSVILVKDLLNVEIETLSKNPTSDYFSPISVEKPKETIKENISKSLPVEETMYMKVETFTTTSTETISQVLPVDKLITEEKNAINESTYLTEELLIEEIKSKTKASTESDSQDLLTENPSKLEKKPSSKNLTTIPAKEEIETLTSIGPTKSDLPCLPAELSLDEKIQNVSENLTATDNLSIPDKKLENNEVEIKPPKLITSDIFEEIAKKTSTVKEKIVPKNFIEYHVPKVIEELINEAKIETLKISGTPNNPIEESVKHQQEDNLTNIATEINNSVVTITESSEVEKEFISKNIFSTAPNKQSLELEKSPENVISIEIAAKTIEEIHHTTRDQNLNNVGVEPVEEPINVEKEILLSNLISNETTAATVGNESEIKNERIMYELLISPDTPSVPVADVIKDKMKSLSTPSISKNTSPTRLEQPMEIDEEYVHPILPTTHNLALQIEEPVNEIATLTITPIDIGLQVLQATDTSGIIKEIVSEKLLPTDSSTKPDEDVDKENNSSCIVKEPIEKTTDSLPAKLIITNTPPIHIEEPVKAKTESITTTPTNIFSQIVQPSHQLELKKDNKPECLTDIQIPVNESKVEELKTSTTTSVLDHFLPTPVEKLIEVIKGNTAENGTTTHIPMALQSVKPLQMEKETLTSTKAVIVTQVLPIKESTLSEEKEETLSKKCTSTDTSTTFTVKEPLNSEVETLSTKYVTMDLSVTTNIGTVSEPKLELTNYDFPEKTKNVVVTDELKDIKQCNPNQKYISDTTKSLSIKRSSDKSVDIELEKDNLTVDDLDKEFIDNSKTIELLRKQSDITFRTSKNVTTLNNEENKHDDSNNTVKTYCEDEEEKTNYDHQTSSIDDKIETLETGNSDVSSSFPEIGETSTILCSETESGLKEKSFGIQKLEMSVHHVKTSDDDYFEKTFVQLEQTEKISMGKNNIAEDENKTDTGDKLYTVNESDLNAILCASSLQEALTLLDSKIKFKFKHGTKKTSGKTNSVVHKSNMQTSSSSSSGRNTNFAEAREYFKTIEKKSTQ